MIKLKNSCLPGTNKHSGKLHNTNLLHVMLLIWSDHSFSNVEGFVPIQHQKMAKETVSFPL